MKDIAHELEMAEYQGTMTLAVRVPLTLIGFWFLAHPWPLNHWMIQAAWTVYAAYFLFGSTSSFHEAAHYTLFRSRTVNVVFGRFVGTILLVPYTLFREGHVRHHAYLNRPSDWELWPYCDPNSSLWFRRVYVWLDLVFGAFTSPFMYGRVYFHKLSPIRSPRLRATIRHEYLAMLLVWVVVLGLVTYYGAWVGFMKIWGLPHLVAGIIQTARKLTEHLGMASYDPLLGTRTVLGNGTVTRLCSFLNYDMFVHGLHHRHPKVTHDRLEPMMRQYVALSPNACYPIFSTYWRAMWHMAPCLLKNPGVGVNVVPKRA